MHFAKKNKFPKYMVGKIKLEDMQSQNQDLEGKKINNKKNRFYI